MAVVGALALAQLPRTLHAQEGGSIDLGAFLQLDKLDAANNTKSVGGGAGGRLGIFFGPRWELEGEGSYSQADPVAPRVGKATQSYYIARLNYNAPFGSTSGNAVIISAGAGANRLDGQSNFTLSPEIGLRTQLNSVIGLRFDVLGMFVTSGTNVFSAPANNFEARIGLNFLFARSSPAAPAPAVTPPSVAA